ncbi:hypothetical protein HY493_00650 [Candidatus Woesearchaeota archaeon]|nr:hypothetical protein [Candidatus Woesearchaeota archaeon]
MGAKEKIHEKLRELLTEERYRVWISTENIRFDIENDCMVVAVPNQFYLELFRKDFDEPFRQAALNAGCKRYDLRVNADLQEKINRRQTQGVPRVLPIEKPQNPHEQLVNILNPYFNRLTYNAQHLERRYANPSRLIIDSNNRIVHTHLDDLLLWMREPQHERQSQTIFIQAESGMGKTSLLQGLSWRIFRETSDAIRSLTDARVKPGDPEFDYLMRISKFAFRYVPCRKFVEDVIQPVKYGKSKEERLPAAAKDFGVHESTVDPGWEFFRRIYGMLDVLIVDDIQHIARLPKGNRESFSGTKNQLNSIIDDLLGKDKSIVIASDVPAEQLKPGLPPRLFNRICQGLRLKISPPSTDAKIQVFYMNAVGAGLDLKIPRSEGEQDRDPVFQLVSDLVANAVGYRDIERFVTNIRGRYGASGKDAKAITHVLLELKAEESLHQEPVDESKLVIQILDVAARLANRPTRDDLKSATDVRSVTAKRAAALTAYQLTSMEPRKLALMLGWKLADYNTLLDSSSDLGRLNPRTRTIESVITDHFVQLTQAPKPTPKEAQHPRQ